ncbi:MAG: DUF4091 domain-containing protein [Oscillospiraceae bacterium]|nr:DUF4091 domain-containing protein [Oscillospiraceae bacterium]
MRLMFASENEWLYPDTALDDRTQCPVLDCARGGSAGVQVLTDHTVGGPVPVQLRWQGLPQGVRSTVYRLLPAHVSDNSGAELFTTLDYESVRHFVTRQAPFDVYDMTRPVENSLPDAGRLGLYIRFDAAQDCIPGLYAPVLEMILPEETLKVTFALQLHACCVPPLHKAGFHCINWLKTEQMCSQHGISFPSPEYTAVLDAYLKDQVDMRTDYLMLPAGDPVTDADGRVVDFDFSHAVHVGQRALAAGYNVILGGFVAEWITCADPRLILLWGEQAEVASLEAYAQLRLYFEKLWKTINENGWLGRYQQCLVDEPQLANSDHYRILADICRKFLPGVPINDPVESCNLEGALDIWVVKQAVFEAHLEKFRALQALGEEMWIYTCGFPAGSMMNRVLDLPLSVSRLVYWMSVGYGAKGFLHWGYNVHNPAAQLDTIYWRNREERIGLPPGNGFVVYPGAGGPVQSMRGHAQRTGTEDAELLWQLMKKDEAAAQALIARLCTGFDAYEPSAAALDAVRRELLCALDALA